MSGDSIGVIGAGSSGLAALKVLATRGFPVVCYERGSRVGGNWRYENDSGTSAAFASLRCNVSRRRMQYPSFPMPRAYGDFPSHRDMAAYFEAYVDRFQLWPHIRFSTAVEEMVPADGDGWRVGLCGGEVVHHRVVVVANGHHWDPQWPELLGTTSTARIIHSREYRTPGPFAGQRVLVIGAGQSAVEIAVELCRVAARTMLCVRSGAHVIPRHLLGRPFDALDVDLVNRLPWRVLDRLSTFLVSTARMGDAAAFGLRRPPHRLIEQVPVVSSDLLPALRSGAIAVRPAADRLDGASVRFVDGSLEAVDAIVCATGYRVSFPFLSPALIAARGVELPLYRRIVPPDLPGLYFIGLVDAPGGLLPIVELQAAWLADLLDGRLLLPERGAMWAAIDVAERRSRERFPLEPRHSIRCDPHAYARVLARDRRRSWTMRAPRRGKAAVTADGTSPAARPCGTSPCWPNRGDDDTTPTSPHGSSGRGHRYRGVWRRAATADDEARSSTDGAGKAAEPAPGEGAAAGSGNAARSRPGRLHCPLDERNERHVRMHRRRGPQG